MNTKLGERIRELRTEQKMLIRQLASKLDIDTSIVSKVERGDRQLRKEQIPKVAEILNVNKEELTTLWLADQLNEIIKDEPLGTKAMDLIIKNKKQK